MKNLIPFRIIVLLVVLVLSSCTKNFDHINTNPNAPENVPATTLLISAITNGMFGTINTVAFGTGPTSEGSGFRTSGYWVQYYTIYYGVIDCYGAPEGDFTHPWNLYEGPLQDAQKIIDNPENGPNMVAAAMVIRAYLFEQMVDLLGDVPYSQALKIDQYVQPQYDTQAFIYHDLVDQLAAAAAQFDPAKDALGEGDVLYNGDIGKWKKLANSLRARLLNQYKHLEPGAAQELKNLLTGGPVFDALADEAKLSAPSGYNRLYTPSLYVFPDAPRAGFGISATMVDMLKALDDPRLPVYAQPNKDGVYKGAIVGDKPALLDTVSDIGTVYRNDRFFPVFAMAYDELLFTKAEAFLPDNPSLAKQAYLDGITASMDSYGITADPAYYANAAAAFDADPLKAIITQKWIAAFAKNSIAAYNDYRRTGYPVLQESICSFYPGQGIPRRYRYPAYEQAANGANLNAAKTRQGFQSGEDVFGPKMWWAK